ncbi:M1 family aminopeptidase [Thalassoroseus pseudoceratinae]|uniref:M1 family aminopeptidase n=1 Tax=Thalassoroseus pseudoceratinae TaxID=2713176 RepID=UPI00141F2DEE|nr:M1 family aminopeptidase [Thalassoroseus pseudoceratinae]
MSLRLIVLNVLLAGFVQSAWAEEPLRTAADRPVDVLHIRLNLDVDLQAKTVAGSATLEFTPLRPLNTITLDAIDHEVISVTGGMKGGKPRELSHSYDGKQLTIEFPETTERKQLWQVTVQYRVREPEDGLHFFQPTKAEPNVRLSVWSQGEPTANRYWFPCYDNPNEKQTTEMIVTVPKGMEALSNGELLSREDTDTKTKFHWKQAKPHVSYLVTLAVGEYVVTEETWRGKPVTYYVEPGHEADTNSTFGRTREMLDFFSERFGIEYPWEKYAQVVVEQFDFGGMENTSATTLNQSVMHDETALLDSTPDRLIAHELGHQWWGDLLTCQDWSHLWLNEGFATYCEVLWWEHKLGREERDYLLWGKAKSARSGTALKRPVVDRHYPRPFSMFDSRSYPKGGWILHMLRSQLGDEEFFGAIQRYGTVYAYQSVETTDLRQILERMTGYSLERFFYDWTERPGHPLLDVKSAYEADDHLVRIDIKQTQDQDAFQFPLAIELEFEDAKPQRIERRIESKNVSFYLPVPSKPRGIRVDPEYTLLAKITENKPQSWWKRQLLDGPTVPERLRAIEHFAGSKRSGDVELLQTVLENDRFWGVRVEAAKALGKTGGDIARDALIAACDQTEAKVRTAAAKALGEYARDETALTALAKLAQQTDPSDAMTAAVIESLAKVQEKPDIEPLLAALDHDSRQEIIRKAALRGLGRSSEAKAVEVLHEWIHRGHPRAARASAIASLAECLTRFEFSEQKTTKIVDDFTRLLDQSETPTIRRASAEALLKLGRRATSALSAVEALAEHDPNGRVRTAAEKAAEAIRTAESPKAELKRLQTELKELRQQNTGLKDRLIKLEAK